MIKIYHNNRCGKSRCALQVLQAGHPSIEIVEYLKNPPTVAELTHILQLLGKKPFEMIRTKEPVFQEKYKGKSLSDEEWIQVMTDNPILIERPIVVAGDKAWVARDETSLDEIKRII